ncbi:MAG TPA: M14 family zinc carboxypeptidase, partial [Fimbriimonadaceae bacterium]|nr:M14 family zinc carboxypeptidase [Fimbriimonadaceae bacterium]
MPFAALLSAFLLAGHITSPQEQFGHAVGDDYFLADYKQLAEYWSRLVRESDRIKVVDIGKTEEGRTQYMAIVSDPANMRRLDEYRDISKRLCLAKGLTDAEAKKLANEGKSVVWIDGGLHSSEVLGSQQLIETVYDLVSRDDPETERILKDDIVLCVACNPDGIDLCSDWYMRSPDPLKRSLADLPVLYEKYAGHDDNRDFYASNLAETTNMNR